MKLTLSLCLLVFAAKTSFASPKWGVPRCQLMQNFNESYFPVVESLNMTKEPIWRNIMPLGELKVLEQTELGPMIVITYTAHRKRANPILGFQGKCFTDYAIYAVKLLVDYPNYQFVALRCPSESCAYLKSKSAFISFNFYLDGVRKVQLVDGGDMMAYLKTPVELFEGKI